ncbi:MAG: bifunctional DNA-formamidopyrimidine glycosylase/DNA-(apurinic or apyrimidinic site) lyase [Alphaproteobacteria bacterium]|nr:bifunctional DNA-formamidopyrimidine glycosylase/DNA-(apurinic or apyrimidinic site) lyase [Alphaproteobacteria bacterium]
MPELPEVETVRRGLEPAMKGKTVAHVDVRRPDLRWPFPTRMAERLTGQKVLRLRRRSKYLLIDMESNETLIVHLGMSGRMLIHWPDAPDGHPEPEKHDHVVFDMEGGVRVVFNDPRRFGLMDMCQTAALDRHKLLAHIGPEPLGNGFDDTYLGAALLGRKTAIKTALLDQKLVAGLGNIYVCEALWRARISPFMRACDVPPAKIRDLVPVIREILVEAIEKGGSSLKDYRQTDGDLGYFQHQFAAYGREGKPCRAPDCKGKIVRAAQGGRSTFYCHICQNVLERDG